VASDQTHSVTRVEPWIAAKCAVPSTGTGRLNVSSITEEQIACAYSQTRSLNKLFLHSLGRGLLIE
jgi:hypothetical protein